jgi:hypothetical protein
LLVAGPVAVGAAAVIAIAVGMRGAPVEPAVPEPPEPPVSSRPQTPGVEMPDVAGALVRVRQVADRVAQAVTRTPLDTELDALILDSKRGIAAVLATGGLR